MGRSCVVAMENCDLSSERLHLLHPHSVITFLFLKTLLQGIDTNYRKEEARTDDAL
jgi:hypothetical protein